MEKEDLPELTEKQLAFVIGILEGKTATDAYKGAYSTTGWGNNAIWVESCRMKENPKIALWLKAARKQNMDRAKLTLEEHSAELARLREMSLEAGNFGAAVNAEVSRGKAEGIYVDKKEILHHNKTDLDKLIKLHNSGKEEIAYMYAKQLGLDKELHRLPAISIYYL